MLPLKTIAYTHPTEPGGSQPIPNHERLLPPTPPVSVPPMLAEFWLVLLTDVKLNQHEQLHEQLQVQEHPYASTLLLMFELLLRSLRIATHPFIILLMW